MVSNPRHVQTQRILKNGIKGFKAKRRRRLRDGRSLRSTAKMSLVARHKKKLLEKSNWCKKRRSNDSDTEYRQEEQRGAD